jgi:endonuclease III
MVSLLLSVQTNDLITDRVHKSLFDRVKTLEQLEGLDQEEIYALIKQVNFSKKKSLTIFEMVQQYRK